MRLRGPIAKIFGFSSADRDKPGQFISAPIQPGARKLPYARLLVPFVHQSHVNLCGDACVQMLLAFRGKQYQAKLDENPRGVFTGIQARDASEMLTNAGVKHFFVDLPPDKQCKAVDLAEYLQLCGPVICGGLHHFVLLVGIHEDHVFLHDPWRGPNLTMTLNEFNNFLDWTDRRCMIAPAPG